jgi:hypothetical protein
LRGAEGKTPGRKSEAWMKEPIAKVAKGGLRNETEVLAVWKRRRQMGDEMTASREVDGLPKSKVGL